MTEPPGPGTAGAPAPPRSGAWTAAFAALVALGAGLRLWQFFGDPSLWIDEIAVARNVLERSLPELLTQPLAFNQSAPPGFLLLLKGCTAALGSSEAALRIVPLLAGLISLPLLLKVARRLLPRPAAAIALFLFAISPALVLRSSEVKQYSSDATIAIAIVLAAAAWLERPTRRRSAGLALLCALAPWFSLPSLFVIAGTAPALVLRAGSLDRTGRLRLAAAGAGVLLVVALAGLYARHLLTPAGHAFLEHYWKGGFVPHSLRPALAWLRDGLPQPFAVLGRIGFDLARAATVLAAGGWVVLWRRRPQDAVLVAGPVLVTLLAAFARVYPFVDRLATFLVPLGLVALAASIDAVRAWAARWNPTAGAALAAAGLVPFAIGAVRTRPVVRRNEVRPTLEYLVRHRGPAEPVYVYFAGWQHLAYYGPRLGLDPAGVRVGRCAIGDPAGYAADLDRYAGAPALWVFITHERDDDRAAIVAHLSAIAQARDSLVIPTWPPSDHAAAALYRYDLSGARPDPARPARGKPIPECLPLGPEVPVDSLVRGAESR